MPIKRKQNLSYFILINPSIGCSPQQWGVSLAMDAGLTDRIWPCVHAWRCTLLALSGRHPRLVACPLSGV